MDDEQVCGQGREGRRGCEGREGQRAPLRQTEHSVKQPAKQPMQQTTLSQFAAFAPVTDRLGNTRPQEQRGQQEQQGQQRQ